MSAYDNDPHVRAVDEYFVVVLVYRDDEYAVSARSETRQYTSPTLDSRAIRATGLRTREETEAWLRERQTGPFPSRDAAIASLIGAPR